MLLDPRLEWNNTQVDYLRDCTVAQAFSQQAARTPESIALIAGSEELQYRDLNTRSSHLADRLRAAGVNSNTLVGIAIGRTADLVIGLLAILKAGGAYVPLDPEYPHERLSWIIEDSRMSVVLTSSSIQGKLPPSTRDVKILRIDEEGASATQTSLLLPDGQSNSLAYVIYTSGSTGKPKGVMVENRNVMNFFTGMDRAIGSEPGIWLAVTSVSFDISVLELLWTLTRGFTVVLLCDDGMSAIANLIEQNKVSHLQMTPSLARMLTLDPRAFVALRGLKKLLLGGEAVPASIVHLLRRQFKGKIYNMYGPTETTIWSTCRELEEVGGVVSIGKPIANTQIFILDTSLNQVPIGEAGDLYIGGEGVARGYLNRPELTAERFIEVCALTPEKIYKTGDLARYLPNGDLEFLGRSDYQIKLRGHRIEPGEIEALLEATAGVRQAVVVMREDREGDNRLVAYLIAEGQKPVALDSLRNKLREKLPDYMIPSSFEFLSSLPLTDNGKIDRKALLRLPVPIVLPDKGTDDLSSELEKTVANVWKDALGLSSVGLTDNFFDMGAHSLTVAEVHSKLQSVLGRDIPIVDLFQHSTVRSLAAHLSGIDSSNRTLSDRAQRRRLARQG